MVAVLRALFIRDIPRVRHCTRQFEPEKLLENMKGKKGTLFSQDLTLLKKEQLKPEGQFRASVFLG